MFYIYQYKSNDMDSNKVPIDWEYGLYLKCKALPMVKVWKGDTGSKYFLRIEKCVKETLRSANWHMIFLTVSMIYSF